MKKKDRASVLEEIARKKREVAELRGAMGQLSKDLQSMALVYAEETKGLIATLAAAAGGGGGGGGGGEEEEEKEEGDVALLLPVIDIGATDEDGDTAVVEQVREACETLGFLAVTGHGLSREVIERASRASRDFFSSPAEEKQAVAAAGTAYGYFPMESEALGYDADVDKQPDLREAFSCGPHLPPPARLQSTTDDALREVVDFCHHPTPWPTDDLRIALGEFYDECARIGAVVLRIMARALGMAENHFDQAASPGEHSNSVRAIWYPKLKCAPRPGQSRCGAHSDTGALTLLYSDGPGLEVQHRAAGGGADGAGVGAWMPARAPRDALIVNIGDLLQLQSKGRWRSTPHRVPAPALDSEANRDRLVLACFVILAADFPLDTSPCSSSADGEKEGETAAAAARLTQGSYLHSHFKRWGRNASENDANSSSCKR